MVLWSNVKNQAEISDSILTALHLMSDKENTTQLLEYQKNFQTQIGMTVIAPYQLWTCFANTDEMGLFRHSLIFLCKW